MPETLPRGRYFGRTVGSTELAGVLFTEKWHSAAEAIPPHAHEHAYLCFALEGSWHERYANRERDCTPRSVIYHPAGEVHADRFGQEAARLFTMELDRRWLERAAGAGPGLTDPSHLSRGPAPVAALRIYEEYCDPDAQSALVVEGLMLELLGSLIRSRNQPTATRAPAWLGRARTRLQDEYRSPPSVGTLAADAEVHPMHLARAFRTHYGCTIGAFVRAVRVERAAQLLAAGRDSLATIAYSIGFCDQSHFTKTFKAATGMTPAQYRAAARHGARDAPGASG